MGLSRKRSTFFMASQIPVLNSIEVEPHALAAGARRVHLHENDAVIGWPTLPSGFWRMNFKPTESAVIVT